MRTCCKSLVYLDSVTSNSDKIFSRLILAESVVAPSESPLKRPPELPKPEELLPMLTPLFVPYFLSVLKIVNISFNTLEHYV